MLNDIFTALREPVIDQCRWRTSERALGSPGWALKNGDSLFHDPFIEAQRPPAWPPASA